MSGGVRLATRADGPTLSALRLELFRELQPESIGAESEFLATCRAAFESLFDEGRALAWIAEDENGTALATLTLLLFPRLPTPARAGAIEGYVVGVFTLRAWRGRGLATGLLRIALAEARRRGLARLRLRATENGRKVYASLGFHARADEMEILL